MHRQRPVVGMQFHPEMNVQEAKNSLMGEWEALKRRGLDPDVPLAQFPSEQTGAEAVFKNFIEFAS